LNGIIDVSGLITVSSNASNIKTINVPISVTNTYFGPRISGSAISINEYVVSHNDAVVTLNSNAVMTNNRFNIGPRSAIVFSHNLDSYDNSTAVLNGDTTADGNLVAGAPVTVVDGNGKLIASGNTSSNGQFVSDVTGWTQTASGKQSVSAPYWVNATLAGKSISQTADGSQSQTITAQA
jgi:hypothetical protein